jgi:ABC-type dipeptide/oligopeptide/nickel transport system permease component
LPQAKKIKNKNMLNYIIRRLIIIIPMALLVVTVTWVLIRMAPGSFYSGEKNLPPAIEQNIKRKYGLDKPVHEQYIIMMGNILRFDFGESLKYEGQSVNEIIKRHFPYSATIGILAYILALIVGLAAGIIASLKQNSAFDYAEFCFRSNPGFNFLALAVLVSSGALGRSFRSCFARDYAFGDLYGVYRATDARRNARNFTFGLYPHGAS